MGGMVIIVDFYLVKLAMIFLFLLGPLYAWGILYFFRDNFSWHWISVGGISTVVTFTALFVWSPRGMTYEQYWYDLVVIFLSALPAMIFVGEVLRRDRKNKALNLELETQRADEYRAQLEAVLVRLELQKEERKKIVAQMKALIEDNQKSDLELVQEALRLIGLRQEAERIINRN